jgi:LacI family transcriptional regulator
LEELPRPCGILTKDDIAAVWTLRILKQLGIRCPDEMPLLGISDDIVFCHMMDPPLSSIPYSGRSVGLQAATLLHRMMSGERIQNDFRIEVAPQAVIHRESTRRVMLNDVIVTRALDFLRGQVERRTVHVGEIARHAGVSRELLRQRFQAVLGCSPKERIEQQRCLHVCDLLRNTDLTLESLAFECGFSGSDEVCRFIKRLTGKTPGAVRREQDR